MDAAALVAPLKIPLTAREPRIAPWLVPAHAETMQIPATKVRDSEDHLLGVVLRQLTPTLCSTAAASPRLDMSRVEMVSSLTARVWGLGFRV